jgi:hypothetical protein
MTSGHLDGPDLQSLLINPNVDLTPDAPFGAAMLTGIPLAFALHLDASAVHQQVQRALGTTVGNVHCQRLLAAG